jgi:hypothetical protein
LPCEVPALQAVPGVEQLAGTEAGQELVAPVSDVVCAVGQIIPAPAVKDLGVRQAADDFGRQLADQFGWVPAVPIDLGDFGRGDRPGASPAPGGGTHEPPSLVWPVGELSAAASASTIAHSIDADRLAAGSATDRALGDGMTRRGSPEPFAPGAPTLPGAPATMPGSGSPGHTGGGADSPAFAALAGNYGPFGLTRGHTLAATEVRSFTAPGAQPGVTPD